MPLLRGFYPLDFPDLIMAGLEIFALAIFFYWLIMLIKGTRAESIGKGLILLLAALWFTKKVELYTLHWVLEKVVTMVFIALPIVFQPELRQALERIGKSRFWIKDFSSLRKKEKLELVSTLTRTTFQLSEKKRGALIVIERTMSLRDWVEGGVPLEGKVTAELLHTIFTPPGPLHDGAVIVKGDKILLARGFLPLTANPDIDPSLGSRHRAAIGLTESTDALVIVVSEETQEVSLSEGGRLTKVPDEKSLGEIILRASREKV